MDAICGNSNLLKDSSAFLDALKNAVNDPEIVAFSNVTARHIRDLGIDQEDIVLDRALFSSIQKCP
ncbi:hypothetical protein QCA50_010994 [Cerrena zonata]|uniref:Uncharacterized protein n=1 Tax=Cerrena zonata TaxID=2478898 RepID=A0AAW0FWS7_9APHY